LRASRCWAGFAAGGLAPRSAGSDAVEEPVRRRFRREPLVLLGIERLQPVDLVPQEDDDAHVEHPERVGERLHLRAVGVVQVFTEDDVLVLGERSDFRHEVGQRAELRQHRMVPADLPRHIVVAAVPEAVDVARPRRARQVETVTVE